MTTDVCYMHLKVIFLTIHFVTYISKVLVSQKVLTMIHVTCIWKFTALTIHFVTYISRVLISQKYSPFLNIYCIVPCCLTYATVMYITMLWMKFVACWCMLWMKSLRFCGVIYIKIYWHLFDIIIYYGNKAVYISWIDAKKLAHNFV